MTGDMFDDPRSQEADELSFTAERLERRGQLAEARDHYTRAALLEEALARETPPSSPRVRGVLAISAVSLWSAAGDPLHALDLAAEFIADPTLPASDRTDLIALTTTLHARIEQAQHHVALAALMAAWLGHDQGGPDFDPDALQRVRLAA